MKYVLVHWSATNNTTVLTDDFVRDKSMLENPNKEGMICFGAIGAKPPKSGWKAFLGRVIFVNGELFLCFIIRSPYIYDKNFSLTRWRECKIIF